MFYMIIYFQLSWRNFSEKKQFVAYQISENKSINQTACNYIATTTYTFVMKCITVSYDPTPNNAELFTWKTVQEYDRATLKIDYFVLGKEDYYMDNHLKYSIILFFATDQKWQEFCCNLLPLADFQTSLQKTVDK